MFPPRMPREAAQAMLEEAYRDLKEGKLLREALRRQRAAGWDPPHDVAYSGEPGLRRTRRGLVLEVVTHIYLHEAFPGVDACTAVFEEVLVEALTERLSRAVARWERKNPAPRAGA